MNRHYQKGYRFENQFLNMLKDEGFQFVARTAGSHSAFDIIGIKDGNLFLFQLKNGELTLKERLAAIDKMPLMQRQLWRKSVLVYKKGKETIMEEVNR